MFGATIYGTVWHGDDELTSFGVNTYGSNQYGQIHLDPRKRIHVVPPIILSPDGGYGGGDMPRMLVGGKPPTGIFDRDKILRDDEDILTALIPLLAARRKVTA